MHWNSIPIHVIDFEGSPNSGVLEYGICTLQHGNLIQTHSRLCQPTGEISPMETRQHGISREQTTNTRPFSTEWELMSKLRKSGPFAAHHAPVENNFLKRTWPHPKTSPNFESPTETTATWGPWIDTCQLFKALYPDLPSHSLMKLIHLFKLEENLESLSKIHCPKNRQKHHCALYDAIASACLIRFLSTLAGFQNITIPWLLQYSKAKNNITDNQREFSLDL